MSDLFKFFDKMNEQDFSYVDKMSDDEVKKISPFVLSMWVNGAKSNREAHTVLFDQYVNPHLFTLQKHPRLLLKLIVASNGGMGNTRFGFEKAISKNDEKTFKLIARHFKIGYNAAKQYKQILSEDDLKELKELYDE